MNTEQSSHPGPVASARVEALLAQMTLEEKLGQMTQHAWGLGDPDEVRARVKRGQIGSFLNAGSLNTRNELQRLAMEETRLGIPLIFGRDVIHGFKTVFPIPLGQAASFNPELVERAAAVAALEASEQGIDWTFAPMVDIGRDPRWGRVAESCGEDPFLTAQLGAAMVRGFQGEDVSDGRHVAACAKHFVGYGASESGKDYNTTWLPEPLLRDVHLPPFRACVEAGVLTLMSAFNDLNGVPASVNPFTLRQVLKGEWAFGGFVVSDWAALMELLQHGLCGHPAESAREAVAAGLDMEMATTCFRDELPALVERGLVNVAFIDESVRRILAVKEKLGLFERPYRDAPTRSVHLCDDHRRVARELSQQSLVLLNNDQGLLPLRHSIRKLALVGALADDGHNQLGCWTLDGEALHSVTLKGALSKRLPDVELLVAPGVADCRSDDTSGFADAVHAAKSAELVIACVGEDANLSGEAKCRAFLDLPGAQPQLIEQLAATGTPLVVIVMAGRPLVLEQLVHTAGALLYAWHPGTEGGEALTDVLVGDVNPSGKLPMSFPRATGQIPVYYAHKNTGRPPQGDRKGVPTGTPLDPVDFDSSYVDLDVAPLFPFGFGLSYTRFGYRGLSVAPATTSLSEPVTVSVEVTNEGERAGTETVQLYVRDRVASMTRPVRELKGFQRVELQPSERKTVRFELHPKALAFTGRDMRPCVEPGRFQVFVGGDCTATLCAEFEIN